VNERYDARLTSFRSSGGAPGTTCRAEGARSHSRAKQTREHASVVVEHGIVTVLQECRARHPSPVRPPSAAGDAAAEHPCTERVRGPVPRLPFVEGAAKIGRNDPTVFAHSAPSVCEKHLETAPRLSTWSQARPGAAFVHVRASLPPRRENPQPVMIAIWASRRARPAFEPFRCDGPRVARPDISTSISRARVARSSRPSATAGSR